LFWKAISPTGAGSATCEAMRIARDDAHLFGVAAPSAEGDLGNAFHGDIICIS
jgi:hypothetical protein